MQAIEGNPLTAEEIAMFETFEREGWSPERRRAHIARRVEDRGRAAAPRAGSRRGTVRCRPGNNTGARGRTTRRSQPVDGTGCR